MSENIKQAENAIKAGDTKTGFEILRHILVENPESERAWWIMSGLVQRAERATCLEQVLLINPSNQFARDALNELKEAPPSTETKPARELPKPYPGKKPTGKTERVGEYKTWHYTKGSTVYLIILGDIRLIQAQTETKWIPRVRDALKKGLIPDQYLSGIKTIPLARINSIKLLKTALQFHYQDGPSEHSTRVALDNTAMAERIMDVLVKRLGPDYLLQIKPVRTGLTLAISAILVLGTSGITWAGYQAYQEVVSGRAAATGSVLSPVLINLLQSLGTGGVTLIGGVLILIALAISIRMLLKPTLGTELVRRD